MLRCLAAVVVGVTAAACSGSADRTTTVAVSTTTLAPTTTVATTTLAPTTTTVATTTVSPDARTAEIEAILLEVEFRRVDAIYDKDAEALAGVVATQKQYDSGLELFETAVFTRRPSRRNIAIDLVEVLLDREDCLVAHVVEDFSAYLDAVAVTSENIQVLWPSDITWRLAAAWGSGTPETVWIDDCDLLDRTWEPPG